MYEYHVVLTIASILFGVVGNALYIRSVVRGATKPHVFTWLSFFIIDIIIFAVQLTHGGGLGAWVTFASVVAIFIICILALKRGEKNITLSDWISFAAALAGIVLWRVMGDPLAAVVLLTATNTIATIPTIRKSYAKPFEESISLWSLDIAKFTLGIFALSSITLTTALFPAGIVVTNSFIVALILFRRAIDRKRASGSV